MTAYLPRFTVRSFTLVACPILVGEIVAPTKNYLRAEYLYIAKEAWKARTLASNAKDLALSSLVDLENIYYDVRLPHSLSKP